MFQVMLPFLCQGEAAEQATFYASCSDSLKRGDMASKGLAPLSLHTSLPFPLSTYIHLSHIHKEKVRLFDTIYAVHASAMREALGRILLPARSIDYEQERSAPSRYQRAVPLMAATPFGLSSSLSSDLKCISPLRLLNSS